MVQQIANILHNILEGTLQILSHPAWQGVGSITGIIGILLTIVFYYHPRQTNPNFKKSSQKSQQNSKTAIQNSRIPEYTYNERTSFKK